MRNRKPHMNNICFEIDRFLRYRSQYEYIGIFMQFCVLYHELCESFGDFKFVRILGVPSYFRSVESQFFRFIFALQPL